MRWNASIQELIKREHNLSIIIRRQYSYPNDHVSRLRCKTQDPKELEISLEHPRALKQIVELLYGRPIDYKKVADEMLVTPTFLEEILEAHAEKLQPSPKADDQLHLNQGKLLSFARRSAL